MTQIADREPDGSARAPTAPASRSQPVQAPVEAAAPAPLPAIVRAKPGHVSATADLDTWTAWVGSRMTLRPRPETRWQRLKAFAEFLGKANVSFLASAVAFYGMLSIFPGLAVAVSLYGLIADPATVERQIAQLGRFLPGEALALLSDQLKSIVTKNSSELSIGFIVGLLLALWSARAASSSLMTALNFIYRRREDRSWVAQQVVALVLTFAGALFGAIALVLVAIVPAVIGVLPDLSFLPGWREVKLIIGLTQWPALAFLIAAGFALIYRFAPDRQRPDWRKIALGSIAGTALWIAGSALFTVYVSRFSSYDKVYGSLGAVVVLLMWFYVSALAVLIGASLDAIVESWAARIVDED